MGQTLSCLAAIVFYVEPLCYTRSVGTYSTGTTRQPEQCISSIICFFSDVIINIIAAVPVIAKTERLTALAKEPLMQMHHILDQRFLNYRSIYSFD